MGCKSCLKCPKCKERKILATLSITKDTETGRYTEKKYSYICKVCNEKWEEFEPIEDIYKS
jgi:hypothetical protein